MSNRIFAKRHSYPRCDSPCNLLANDATPLGYHTAYRKEAPPFTEFKYPSDAVTLCLRKIGTIAADHIRTGIGAVLTSDEVKEMAYDMIT
jgi:hypothetical protein